MEKQKAWNYSISSNTFQYLCSTATNNTELIRLKGLACFGAGDWLNTLPQAAIGLKLNNEELRVAVAFRLGSPISLPHICVCGSQADEYGLHALNCKRLSSRHARHQILNDIIANGFHSAKIPVIKEPTGLSRSDGKRPDGTSIIPWERGKCLAWDVTCINRLALSYSSSATHDGPEVANLAEDRKRSKYESLSRTHIVQPISIETLGGLGKASQQFLAVLGKKIAESNDDERAHLFLRQRISMTLQRGNSAIFLETLPQTTNFWREDI